MVVSQGEKWFLSHHRWKFRNEGVYLHSAIPAPIGDFIEVKQYMLHDVR
jgi:hypothetical protein